MQPRINFNKIGLLLILFLCLGRLAACSTENTGVKQKVEFKKMGSTLHSKEELPIGEIPASALQAIAGIYPEFEPNVAEKEFKHGKVYLDIEGDLSGSEIEFDMLQNGESWEIVEVQRDLIWEELPALVKEELVSNAPGFEAKRIIESIQHGTAVTIYEFYARDSQGVESRKEIILENGIARLLQEEWQH